MLIVVLASATLAVSATQRTEQRRSCIDESDIKVQCKGTRSRVDVHNAVVFKQYL